MTAENTLADGEVAINLRRDGKGAPLLFLHGALGQFSWPAALASLASRFDVIAPDLPGFGATPRPERVTRVEDIAYVMLDLIERLGAGPVHLVGHSLGGWVALEMAIRSTASIRSLVLADAAGIRVRDVPRADLFRHGPTDLAKLVYATGADQAEWLANAENAMVHEANRYTLARLSWQPQLHNPQLQKWLHRIHVPTLVVWGDQDRVLPPAHAHALAAAIDGATVALMPGCGHMAPIERPEAFSDIVTRFIDGVTP